MLQLAIRCRQLIKNAWLIQATTGSRQCSQPHKTKAGAGNKSTPLIAKTKRHLKGILVTRRGFEPLNASVKGW